MHLKTNNEPCKIFFYFCVSCILSKILETFDAFAMHLLCLFFVVIFGAYSISCPSQCCVPLNVRCDPMVPLRCISQVFAFWRDDSVARQFKRCLECRHHFCISCTRLFLFIYRTHLSIEKMLNVASSKCNIKKKSADCGLAFCRV